MNVDLTGKDLVDGESRSFLQWPEFVRVIIDQSLFVGFIRCRNLDGSMGLKCFFQSVFFPETGHVGIELSAFLVHGSLNSAGMLGEITREKRLFILNTLAEQRRRFLLRHQIEFDNRREKFLNGIPRRNQMRRSARCFLLGDVKIELQSRMRIEKTYQIFTVPKTDIRCFRRLIEQNARTKSFIVTIETLDTTQWLMLRTKWIEP